MYHDGDQRILVRFPMLLSASVITAFESLDDPRVKRCQRHVLIDIVTIAICAVIANADSWTDIEAYGQAKESFLRQFLILPNGIPSHDTFSRVFAQIDPIKFQTCFLEWIRHLRTIMKNDIIAIDGKTSRRTGDTGIDLSPLHMISAWSTSNQLILGQWRTDEKSNEITAIPQLLDVLDIEKCTVTIDAMGCQTALVEQIRENNADYMISCKENQKRLHADIKSCFENITMQQEGLLPFDYHETISEGHGRHEVRKCWTMSDLTMIRDREKWKDLTSIVMIKSERTIDSKTTEATRYYISSLSSDAARAAHTVRSHWEVENKVHWVLDVVFHDDGSRARIDNSAHNFVILRHIALNLVKQENSLKKSFRQKRLRAGWDDTYLKKIICAGTDEE